MAGVDWVSVCGESLCVTTCTDLPASSSQLLCGSEDLLHGSGDDASGLLILSSLHGVRLPTSCLTVGEAAHVVAVQRRLDQQGDLLEDLMSAIIINKASRMIDEHWKKKRARLNSQKDFTSCCNEEGPNTRSKLKL